METIKYCNLLHAGTHSTNMLKLQLFSSVQFNDKRQCLFKYLCCSLKLVFFKTLLRLSMLELFCERSQQYGLLGLTSDLQIVQYMIHIYMEELAVLSI